MTLGNTSGMSTQEVMNLITEVGEKHMAFLFGGYAADMAVVGLYLALRVEELDHDDIVERIGTAIHAAWDDIV